jgi:hypothetical protein
LYKKTCEKLIRVETNQRDFFKCSFANEPLTIKPVTCVPGIGPKHGDLCEKQGSENASDLIYFIFLFKNCNGSSIVISIYDECE